MGSCRLWPAWKGGVASRLAEPRRNASRFPLRSQEQCLFAAATFEPRLADHARVETVQPRCLFRRRCRHGDYQCEERREALASPGMRPRDAAPSLFVVRHGMRRRRLEKTGCGPSPCHDGQLDLHRISLPYEARVTYPEPPRETAERSSPGPNRAGVQPPEYGAPTTSRQFPTQVDTNPAHQSDDRQRRVQLLWHLS